MNAARRVGGPPRSGSPPRRRGQTVGSLLTLARRLHAAQTGEKGEKGEKGPPEWGFAPFSPFPPTRATEETGWFRPGPEPWNPAEACRLTAEVNALVGDLGLDGRDPEVADAAAVVASAYRTRDMETVRFACGEFGR